MSPFLLDEPRIGRGGGTLGGEVQTPTFRYSARTLSGLARLVRESQKMKVIENFDRASNLREVKLIFSTLCESFTSTKTKRSIKESYASKPSRSTAPKKEILSEGNQLAARWKKLANLK